ncbi:FtsX-like permease family protein [Coprococcus comes]|uniref:FtsX-like permease family protein n=1 Tax=Coprococcus comes TaxID=410072 RepID=UPI001570623E|nr:FtsX-like permease family protein [Coprococcus comes]NSD14738.1 FtsX-like permease family protein [Coprococcus comes]NSG43646.1 FtsX-like permease family protein [Coprococcus comes]
MKKNILRKDFIIEIKKTMGRFVSIFFIVALGVAFYSGIRASEPSMRITADQYFDDSELMDLKVMGTMGLTKADIKAIGKVSGIEAVEGGYSKDVLCPVGDNEKVVHMLSMQKNFNQVSVVKGRLPEKAGECLVDEDFLSYTDLKVGDTVTFHSGDGEALTDSLVTDTYKIVGIGNSPLYISFGRGSSTIGTGEISGFVVVDKASFDMDVYTEAYVKVSGAEEKTAFTDEYNNLSDAAKEAVSAIEEERCAARKQEIVDEANEKLADSEKTVNEKSQELEDAKKELESGKSKAAEELEKAKQQLTDGEAELADAKQQIADGETQLADAKAQLNDKQAQLDSAEAQYESGKAQLDQKEQELADAEQVYLSNYSKYMPIITAGKKQIPAGKSQIADGKKRLDEGLAPLNQLKDELAGIEDEISQCDSGIAELQKQLDGMDSDVYQEYVKIPEEDRNEEQQAYVNKWENLNAQLAGIQAQKTQLETAKSGLLAQAGFATEADLDAQITSLTTQRDELDKKEAALLGQEQTLAAQEEELLSAGRQITDGKSQIAAARTQLDSVKSQITDGKAQIQSAWALLNEKEGTLNASKAQLASGEQELADGRSEYEQAVKEAEDQISDGQEKIIDGEKQLTDAKQQIADAKAEIKKIENPKWYVQTREDALTEYQGYGDNADRMRSIGKVFPVLFFLVAALISLTTMTRMVEEQRVQIGTMKALGYGKAAIAGKYIGYALIATLGGSIFGVLAGEKILPFIIIYAYMILYKHLPAILVPYHMSYALQASGIAIACTLIATIASCYKELAAEPAELMRPAAPKQGKRILLERIGIIWKHLNFTWKSTVRNLIRYKKRFFMTIFGIGGCMALMVVGFGLKDCIYEIVSLQYEKVQFYDAATYMSDDISEENRQQLHDYLDQNADIKETIEARMQKTDVKSASGKKTLYLMVPSDNEKIEDFLSFHSRTNKDEVYSLKKDEVILTEKMASLLNVKVGDELTIEDEDRGDQTVTVGAICENYMSHYLYLSPEKYEELYGVPAEYNTIIYSVEDGKDDQIEKIGTKLLSMDGVLNVSYTSSIEGRLDDMLRSLNLVIVVLIVSAGMLAFVVLYNLNNINITERQRELATLKVLGFYDGEVASYVYRENILLTIIGSVVGMVLGNLLHRYIILTVEVEEAMFGRQIHWQSYLYSFLFTVAFSLFVNWVMFYKLKKIDMVESLKSVE